MGLDMYAGTLTRYYNHNWKTSGQLWAEQNGMEYKIVRPEEQEEEPTSPAEVLAGVCGWRDELIEGLGKVIDRPLSIWDEDNEKPYRTEKPDWDAFGALVICSACIQLREEMPKRVEKGWEWSEHGVLRRAQEDESCGGSLLQFVELWIPIAESITFDYADPCGNEGTIGTVGGLLGELEGINEKLWKADPETIAGWQQSEGYPATFHLIDGQMVKIEQEEPSEYDFMSLVKYAFSILYELTLFAKNNRTPIKLDY